MRRSHSGDDRGPAKPDATVVGSPDTFGARLRRERERRQIDLRSVTDKTKIAPALLQGLERDDVTRWPSGIFRRSFIRAYAEAIGLDPDATAHEFFECFPDPADIVSARFPRAGVAMRRRGVEGGGRPVAVQSGERASVVGRLAAALLDVSLLLIVAAAVWVAIGSFWTPFAIATLCYYAGGILVLGSTPGISVTRGRDR